VWLSLILLLKGADAGTRTLIPAHKVLNMDIRIYPHVKIAAPRLALGGVYGTIEVTKYDQALWSEIDHQLAEIGSSFTLEGLSNIPQIKAHRDVYRALGKDPSRRGSQESLLRRVLQGKGLFTINTVVDINNLISLESGHSVGCYDYSHIHFAVIFRIGQKGESYKGIGKQSINLDGLPGLRRRQRAVREPYQRL
jgi:DNA/RNA-binding domain of Phe-tRNA-synthetase-like protein